MIRNTRGWVHCIDRAVASVSGGRHAEHGGWSLAQDGQIYCACTDLLFEMSAVTGEGDARPVRLAAVPDAPVPTPAAPAPGQHVVVLGSHLPYHSSAAWVLGDQVSAERFAAFVTAEIDPAQVLKARDPAGELLAWRAGLATPEGGEVA